MTENVCKNCNAPLDLSLAKNGVITCEFCGSSFTLPKADQSDKVRKYLDAGEVSLDLCRFDDALSAFTKAIELDGSEPEAYWGRALARSGVQYLKDTVNNRLQPVCHTVSREKFIDDSDYKKALELATEEQRAEYKRKAEEIDYIRSEFFKLKESGLKYDCFICVKVTDDNGGHTEDSFAAMRLYNALKKSGYKPFFSEEEMGSRTGADYEALILYALKSSPCMLIVCFDKKYLETKWVKNEYTRYISMIADEEHERDGITIVYRSKPVEKLPGIKGKIQGIDFNSFDAIERIKQFIDSHDEVRKRTAEATAKAAAAQAAKAAEEKAAKESETLQAMQAELKRMQEMLSGNMAGQRTPPAPAAQQAELAKSSPAAQQAEPAKSAPPKPQSMADKIRSIPKFEIKDGVLVKYNSITSGDAVVIPDGVREIGPDAFYDNKGIASVTIPEGVTKIGGSDNFFGAFAGCKNLQKVVLPNGLKTIAESAFRDCVALREIELPDGVTVGKRAFFMCTKLKHVVLMGSADIGERAFDCGNEHTEPLQLTFADRGTVTIGDSAFSGRKIVGSPSDGESAGRLVIPGSVKKIGNDAFRYTGITAVEIQAGTKSIGSGAFFNIGLKEAILPDTLTEIGDGAFGGRKSGQQIIMSPELKERFKNRLTAIVANVADEKMKTVAAQNCKMKGDVLTGYHLPAGAQSPWGTITLPENTRVIGSEALASWDFYEIILPAGVREIGPGGIRDCTKLQTVWLPYGLTKIAEYAFSGCSQLTTDKLPATVREIGKFAFADCGMEAMTVPDGVKEIPAYMFYKCAKLREVTIPASVRKIDESAFSDCDKLEKVIIPDGVTEIADGTFFKCAALKEIAIPASANRIGNCSFYGCASLEKVIIPDGVTEIADGAFSGCAALKEVMISASVSSIGKGAFSGCKMLKAVKLPSATARIGEKAFFDCAALGTAVLPSALAEIAPETFSGCKSLREISVPDGCKTIGQKAFADCKSLVKADLPDALETIGESAFAGCAAPEYFLPAGLKSIAASVFRSGVVKVTVHVPRKKPFLSQPEGWDKNWAGEGVKVKWNK